MRLVSGWRLAVRLAWREAWRAKGRSALVLVMVTFPVVAVVAADVAQATAGVSTVEGLDRKLGAAQAEVTAVPGAGSLVQLPDPEAGGYVPEEGNGRHPAPGLDAVLAALGGARPSTELRSAGTAVRTSRGGVAVTQEGVELGNPLTHGLYRITSGRPATRAGEVDINAALASYGFGIGDMLHVGHGQTRTVVGLAESTTERSQPLTVGPLADVGDAARRYGTVWLVGGAPVTWDDVRSANRVGALVLSRQVIEHPPSSSELPAQAHTLEYASSNSQLYTVLALIGVMTLLEVVLLAGPAFAVGARRQSRNLALIAANGGTPAQSRRTILASAVVLGSVGAGVGVVLGILLGRVVLPFLQQRSDQWFGPFQVRWDHVAVVAVFGLLSALLAAVVPAWIASRQDVVAVLAGRRGDRRTGLRSPVVGVVLLGAGVALATMGARRGAGDLLIAVAAVVSVFGMIFLVPVVVVGVARLGRRFPLPLRYAVRDAARHRTRTVPAVAAVAATVAGVVALSIANTSDQAQARAQYVPQLPVGTSAVSASGDDVDWSAFAGVVRREAPGSRVLPVTGVATSPYWDVGVVGRNAIPAGTTSSFPTPVLVDDGRDDAVATLLTDSVGADQLDAARAALARGRVVVFTDGQDHAAQVHLSVGTGRHRNAGRFPATYLDVSHRGGMAPTQAVVPRAVVRALGVQPRTAGLLVTGTPLTHEQEKRIDEVVYGMHRNSYLYVERGYQVPGSEQVVLWILFGLAGVLMLGGTLTATFLALSDARPDLATLSAVGAAPRTRRGVAAAYAVSVGVVGAALGAAVGFIPGIAISYPLTRGYVPGMPSHYLAIPWLEIVGLVVLLPLVTALVVGLTARSRLPLVARLD
jgi:putative ABC transport system permease protein